MKDVATVSFLPRSAAGDGKGTSFRRLVDGLCVGAAVIDGNTFTMNAALARMIGFTAEELTTVDEWFTKLFGAQADLERERYRMTRTRGFRTPSYSMVRDRAGNERTLEISRSMDGAMELWIVSDITVMRDTQDALLAAREAAEVAGRAKSSFLATMSHEIRTPMNGVVGMTELLLGTPLSAEQREYLETIRASNDILLRVVDDILDFSRLESQRVILRRVPFSVRSLVEDCAALFTPIAQEKGVAFVTDIESPNDALLGDPGRLRQVIQNLLSNAVKFTSAGEITVKVRGAASVDDKVMLQLSVSDTGLGIAHDAQDAIFDVFSQVDDKTTRETGGIGLGLSICRAIVTLMGGALTCTSEPGRGSTFSVNVLLPRQPVPERIEPAPSTQKAETGHALVADDNVVNVKIVTAMLTRLGWTADVVSNGQDAVSACQRRRYDIVFMDCQMPVLDGFDATRLLRSSHQTNDLFVAALTANAVAGDEERCFASGMNHYLSKPLRIPELEKALRAALAHRAQGHAAANGG